MFLISAEHANEIATNIKTTTATIYNSGNSEEEVNKQMSDLKIYIENCFKDE